MLKKIQYDKILIKKLKCQKSKEKTFVKYATK